jgi:hypothetical protein
MCIRFYRLCTDRVPAHRIALRAAPHALTLKKGTVKIQKVNGKVAGLKRASGRSVTPAARAALSAMRQNERIIQYG